jgi:cytochrome c-type biogenesis protein CcmH
MGASSALAGEALPTAADPALEARVMRLAAELRCLVCQNQSLADSHADLAIDLKNQVREQFKAGSTENQVIAYMTERYGDFVLYRPPLKQSTLLLWGGPALLLMAGAALLWAALGRHARPTRSTSPAANAEATPLCPPDVLLGTAGDRQHRPGQPVQQRRVRG